MRYTWGKGDVVLVKSSKASKLRSLAEALIGEGVQ